MHQKGMGKAFDFLIRMLEPLNRSASFCIANSSKQSNVNYMVIFSVFFRKLKNSSK